MKVRVASAGTGKTTALVFRYLELLAEYPPHRIAAVTFTRAAAAQLRTRIHGALLEVARSGSYKGRSVGEKVQKQALHYAELVLGAPIHTIHGFFAETLRLVAPLVGLDPEFVFLDATEAETIFREEAAAYLYLQEKGDELEELLLARYRKRPLAEELRPIGARAIELEASYRAVEDRYWSRLGGKLLGPADVELKAIQLFSGPPAGAMERILSRYAYVFVDEYQDTNPLQVRAFTALEANGVPVEVVGDPKQSIYAFRNADVEGFRKALAEGEPLTRLDISYRHAPGIVRFLNRLTRELALGELGFKGQEAFDVSPNDTSAAGEVELFWVTGPQGVGELRVQEAHLLAKRLRELRSRFSWREMAVLVRSRGSVPGLEAAFSQWGIPYVTSQARGFYNLPEVRDLYHALRSGFDAGDRLSLAAFLRGPFIGLSLRELDQVFKAENPLEQLEHFPLALERLRQVQDWVGHEPPFAALTRLVREPFLGGASYFERLNSAARANVDALLLKMASYQPERIEMLLAELENLQSSDEEGEVPEGGEDVVRILTVHGAKGLEWPLVAVFDLSRGERNGTDKLHVHGGEFGQATYALAGDPEFGEHKNKWKEKIDQERYRLLYVAASRPSRHLLLTGSVQRQAEEARFWRESWARVLWERLDVNDWPELKVQVVSAEKVKKPTGKPAIAEKAPAPDGRLLLPVPERPRPPVYSPSAVRAEKSLESLEEDEAMVEEVPREAISGFARTVGILGHYAISQNWQLDNHIQLAILKAQREMARYSQEEQSKILAEVQATTANFWRMEAGRVGSRQQDYAELPLMLPLGPTVWEGVIDRLYRLDGDWYLDDYKTDQQAEPEKYHFQLGVYLEAVRRAWKIEPRVRLVYLRLGQVYELRKEDLEAAVQAVIGQGLAEG